MDFAPTAWVVQTVRAYPELAVFLANRRTAEASVSGGELVDWILTVTAAAYNLIRLRTLLAGREVGRGTAGAPLDRTRQGANLVVTSMVIRSRVKRVAPVFISLLDGFWHARRSSCSAASCSRRRCGAGGADDDGRILPGRFR